MLKLWRQTHNGHLIEHLKEAVSHSKDPVVAKTLEKCLGMAQGLEEYLETTCPEETPLQKKLYADTLLEPWKLNYENGATSFPATLNMINARHPTHFMKLIAEIAKAERVLEIGMLTGYSTAIFCDAECVKQVTSLEIDPFMVNFVETRFAGTVEEKKLKIMQGPALESLEKIKEAGETFDLVFIDADKMNYMNYYKFVMDNNLIGSGGVILLDNTLWRAELYPESQTERGKLFVDLNDFINRDERVSQAVTRGVYPKNIEFKEECIHHSLYVNYD